MKTIKVEQFHVKNQFVLFTEKGQYFQSYNSVIAFIPNEGKTQLDKHLWNYSKTTGKYRNLFLGEDKKETQRKIDNKEYELVSLN